MTAGLAVPPGNPAALRQLAGQLRQAAQGAGNLGHDTGTMAGAISSDSAWTGSASEAFSGFAGNLSKGTSATQEPLTRIADAVESYADVLDSAQQKARQATVISQAAQDDLSGSLITQAEEADRNAMTAMDALDQAGGTAAQQVTAAAAGLQARALFGSQGPVSTWIGSQPQLSQDYLWTTRSTPGPDLGTDIEILPPAADLGTGTEILPPADDGGTTEILPPADDAGGAIEILPPAPDLGTGTETIPPAGLGPLANYDAAQPAGGDADAGLRELSPPEADTLVRLQGQDPDAGWTVADEERDGEYVNNQGQTADQMGDPQTSLHWTAKNESAFYSAIDSHLLKSSTYTVIDLNGFSAQPKADITNYVDSLPATSQAKIIRVGF
jgi:uncharacterized protein YukE